MGDRDDEQGPALYVKAPVPEKLAAQEILRVRNRQLKGYVRACLAALIANPDQEIGRLEKHWPEEKHAGRPPKQPD